MSHIDNSQLASATRVGPSPIMIFGLLLHSPFAWVAAAWGVFLHNEGFARLLWSLKFAPWRNGLVWFWNFSTANPWLPIGVGVLAVSLALARFATSFYAYSADYLFVQFGFFNWTAPGGGFSLYTDPIPFSTVLDANLERGLIGLVTGTGTILVRSADLPGGHIRLTWVSNATEVLSVLLEKQGVKNARILSGMNG